MVSDRGKNEVCRIQFVEKTYKLDLAFLQRCFLQSGSIPFPSDNPQEHLGDARFYIFRQVSLYLGELPKRSWHNLSASQG